MWKGVVAGWELGTTEVELLTQACRVLDTIARMEAALADEPMIVSGSTGQPKANPLAKEIGRSVSCSPAWSTNWACPAMPRAAPGTVSPPVTEPARRSEPAGALPMARRRATAAAGAGVREELARRADTNAERWRGISAAHAERMADKARRLRSGEPEEYAGWEPARLVPGLAVNSFYRLESDDSLTRTRIEYQRQETR